MLLERDFNICELSLSDYLVPSSCWCINQKGLEKKFPEGALSLQTKLCLSAKTKKFSSCECFRGICHLYPAYFHEFQFSELAVFHRVVKSAH